MKKTLTILFIFLSLSGRAQVNDSLLSAKNYAYDNWPHGKRDSFIVDVLFAHLWADNRLLATLDSIVTVKQAANLAARRAAAIAITQQAGYSGTGNEGDFVMLGAANPNPQFWNGYSAAWYYQNGGGDTLDIFLNFYFKSINQSW